MDELEAYEAFKKEAFRQAEEYFFELQREAAKEYGEKVQEAYTKAHDFYEALLRGENAKIINSQG